MSQTTTRSVQIASIFVGLGVCGLWGATHETGWTQEPVGQPRGRFAPPPGQTLVVIGQDLLGIEAYIAATGLVPAGMMTYTSLQRLEGLQKPADFGGGLQHAQALVDRYPNTVLQVGLWMVGALEEINRGHYDAHIDRLAAWLVRAKRPVYLRIGFEFELPANRYEPTAYVQAFQRIVERFRQNGVENVAFVWHAWANHQPRPISAWYPGDTYVDWVGVSYFSPTQQPWLEAVATFAQTHRKPLMIAESSPLGVGGAFSGTGAWREWYAPYFTFIAQHEVQLLSYINWDWDAMPMFRDQLWGDCRIDAHELILGNWKTEITRPRFLHASAQLHSQLGVARTE